MRPYGVYWVLFKKQMTIEPFDVNPIRCKGKILCFCLLSLKGRRSNKGVHTIFTM